MMKAIIIDDEPLARSIIIEYLQKYKQVEVIAECNDGYEGLKAIQQHQPDMIFLDIQMPKINGFEMLELLEQPLIIIFTTAFDEYAMQAFEAHAVDYLLKPFSPERFDKAMEKCLDKHGQKEQSTKTEELLQAVSSAPVQAARIVVKTGSKIKIIPVDNVLYLEASDDYVKIHTIDGSFLKNKTMAFFERSLPAGQFVRTHRSYIVNVQGITRIDPYEKENYLAILRTGQQVPVSKSGYVKLKEVLGL